MASVRSSSKVPTRVVFVVALAAIAMVFGLQMSQAQAQGCVTQLTNLNVCAPFVVPGTNASPNSACCGALQAVDHDCFCNTMAIVNRLPSQCNLAPITCGSN